MQERGDAGLQIELVECLHGGYHPSDVMELDFVTIASTGDAIDFGDLTGANGSNRRNQILLVELFCGGDTPSWN